MADNPLRITLVDDSDLASAGLQTLLAPYADRVAVVDNRSALAEPDTIDVVLYEPLGQTSMAAALLRDLQAMSHAQAAVFSWAGPDHLPSTCTAHHLAKSLTASQLVVSVEEIVAGRYTSAPMGRVVPEPEPEPELPAHGVLVELSGDDAFTPREREIVTLIVSGMSNREIGESLSLSINSVKTYIRSAYRKMGVERRTQAVLWGLSAGLASEPPALVG